MTETGESSWPRRRLGEGLGSGPTAHRVIMIDDHALLGESVVMTLRQSGLDARTLAHDTPNLVEAVLTLRPDVVLLDLFLDESAERSTTALATLVKGGIVVIVVTATHDTMLHARCLELGAAGVVEKSEPIEHLIDAVHRALRGEAVMSLSRVAELRSLIEHARRSRVSSPFDSLTVREKEVLHAMLRGEAAGRVARDQRISVFTVRAHIRSVLFKLNVHSQLEAVSLATNEGWFLRT
jgi:DNA-binding NarL/FixJ family response regulator